MLGALLWYAAFGAAHEAAHLLAASALCGEGAPSAHNFLRAALARHVVLDEGEENGGRCDVRAVRHSGWLASVLVAALVRGVRSPRDARRGKCVEGMGRRFLFLGGRWGGVQLAAAVTALEALASDLLQLRPGAGAAVAGGGAGGSGGGGVWLFCGNFGIVMINLAWAAGGSRGALDILEKMVEVTMMRGGVAHVTMDGARHVIHHVKKPSAIEL